MELSIDTIAALADIGIPLAVLVLVFLYIIRPMMRRFEEFGDRSLTAYEKLSEPLARITNSLQVMEKSDEERLDRLQAIGESLAKIESGVEELKEGQGVERRLEDLEAQVNGGKPSPRRNRGMLPP